ncbi:MAG: tetratricopeptide repeat protein [Sphaerochaetaceae bacterium]|nr:tetratricopeptide repeat protein [Sphaerochaetaceae bacterium]
MITDNALAVYSEQQAMCPGASLADLGKWFYRLGNTFSKLGDIEQAIRCWNDAFLVRGEDFVQDDNCEWKKFHDIQFAIYVLGKKRLCVSLSEGDMIHDVIRMKWDELQEAVRTSAFPFAPDDRCAWYRTIEIDFPWELDVEELDAVVFQTAFNGTQRPAACGVSPLNLLKSVNLTR